MIDSRTFVFLMVGLLGLGCELLYSVIAPAVDGNGFLFEPFFLIPLGMSLMAIGALGSLLSFLLSLRHRRSVH